MCNRVFVRAHRLYVVTIGIVFSGTLFEHFLGPYFRLGLDAVGDFIIRLTTDSFC